MFICWWHKNKILILMASYTVCPKKSPFIFFEYLGQKRISIIFGNGILRKFDTRRLTFSTSPVYCRYTTLRSAKESYFNKKQTHRNRLFFVWIIKIKIKRVTFFETQYDVSHVSFQSSLRFCIRSQFTRLSMRVLHRVGYALIGLSNNSRWQVDCQLDCHTLLHTVSNLRDVLLIVCSDRP